MRKRDLRMVAIALAGVMIVWVGMTQHGDREYYDMRCAQINCLSYQK